jgi:hypothetical protein
MKRFVEGEDRRQATLLPECLDDYVAPDNPVRIGEIRRTARALPASIASDLKARSPNRPIYIGQTRRTLCERLVALASGVTAEECPFNDPHTAAPHLWLLRRLDGLGWNAPAPQSQATCRSAEAPRTLLWRHWVEAGLPVEANYGRLYPGYARPTNRWIIRGGRSGSRMPNCTAPPI